MVFYRIRTETNGGAWCPKTAISRESYEYLQIDLGKLTVITMVEIQGRFGNGQVMPQPKGISWVKVFRIIPEFRILRLTFHRKSA